MNDRWTEIRRHARELLANYDRKARTRSNLPVLFTDARGCHAVLHAVLEHAFENQKFSLDLECEALPVDVAGCVQDGRYLQVRHDLAATRKVFIVAHQIGHLKLKHPLPETSSGTFEETAATIDEQPHAGDLSHRDGAVPAHRKQERYELEANIFAAELLAPLHKVRERIESDPGWTVEALAVYFGLSQEAMRNQVLAAFIAAPDSDALDRRSREASRVANDIELDPSQREAARCESPALVIAGPGAGKTRVLTARYVYLVNEQNVPPRRILALTFSNKAASEMEERISRALSPNQANDVQVFTFHSFGRSLLQAYGNALGLPEELTVMSEADAFVMARDHLPELPLGAFKNLNEPTQFLERLISRVSSLKEEQITPDEFTRRVEAWREQLTTPSEEADKCRDLAAFFTAYEQLRERLGNLDYADLINLSIKLFEHPQIATQIRANYDHILVDEFQDINRSCGQLVQAVNGGTAQRKRGIVWAVADPRQSIYSFRGASVSHLARFEHDYPGTQVKFLKTNYRSVEAVVKAGDAIEFPTVSDAEAFRPPELHAHKGIGEVSPAVQISFSPSRWHEISAIVAKVREVIQNAAPDDVAVLCRDRWQAKDISLALEESGIATNWSGQPEEQDAFKDMMAVLYLATNQPQALLRLARLDEHRLSEADLKLILHEAGRRNNKLHHALGAAASGEIAEVSEAGRKMAGRLRQLSIELARSEGGVKPTAWQVLAAYLFEKSTWLRDRLTDPSPQSRRYLGTVCQVIDLARDFSQRHSARKSHDTEAFLDYVASVRESSQFQCADPTAIIANAVNILTMHKSKGLEWPIVFVPGWRQRAERAPEEVPLPLHLVHPDPARVEADEAYSEACLYYVSVTRAENQLFLSRAQEDMYKPVPVPHLKQIFDSLRPQGLVEPRNTKGEAWKRPYQAPPVPVHFDDEVIPYAMIRQHEYCSQRAKYDYVYGLRAEGSGLTFSRRQLHKVLSWIALEAEQGRAVTDEEIESQIAELWNQDAKAQRRISRLYQQQALDCARSFAARVSPGSKIELGKVWHYPVPNINPPLKISFKVDELEFGENPVCRLHRLDAQNPQHLEDPIWSLYALLAPAEALQGIEFRISYLADGSEQIFSVADNEERLDVHRKQIFAAARKIRRGHFEPKPKHLKMCHRCPYNLICPA